MFKGMLVLSPPVINVSINRNIGLNFENYFKKLENCLFFNHFPEVYYYQNATD